MLPRLHFHPLLLPLQVSADVLRPCVLTSGVPAQNRGPRSGRCGWQVMGFSLAPFPMSLQVQGVDRGRNASVQAWSSTETSSSSPAVGSPWFWGPSSSDLGGEPRPRGSSCERSLQWATDEQGPESGGRRPSKAACLQGHPTVVLSGCHRQACSFPLLLLRSRPALATASGDPVSADLQVQDRRGVSLGPGRRVLVHRVHQRFVHVGPAPPGKATPGRPHSLTRSPPSFEGAARSPQSSSPHTETQHQHHGKLVRNVIRDQKLWWGAQPPVC